MYNDFFGFKESPFSIAPDPRYLYMTAQHREALAHLVFGLNSEGGCILLTGEVGTGKTTICRCLLEQIPDRSNVALVLNPKVSEIELLETICDELKIDYPESNNSVKTYTDRIYSFLIESNRKNEKTVLIIDEAQNLDSKVLEQLRLLTNLETHQRKLLQIIILGQPELLDILAKSEMRQLAQRITARFHLRPLTKGEIKAYVSHRLAVAGQNIQLFPESSINTLFRLSNGVPRLINIISDRALLGAYVENQYVVNPRIIKKAAKEVFGELKNVEIYQKKKQWLYPASFFFLITVIIIAAVFAYMKLPLSDAERTEQDVVSDKTNGKTVLKPEGNLQSTTSDTTAVAILPENDTAGTAAELTAPGSENSNTIKRQDDLNTVQNLPAERSVTEYDDIEKILNSSTDDTVPAYQQLFKAWNKNYDNQTAVTACKQAEKFSLACLYRNGNLNSLKKHNRPAVLTLINNMGEQRYITITSLDEESATIFSDNKAYTVSLKDIDRYWYGQFTLLWQKPAYYSSPISPGDSGSIVNWLHTQLTKINNEQASDMIISTYDNYLVNKVKAFQLRQGLNADGIVGPITIIQMNTLSGMNVPSLTPVPKSSAIPSITQQV